MTVAADAATGVARARAISPAAIAAPMTAPARAAAIMPAAIARASVEWGLFTISLLLCPAPQRRRHKGLGAYLLSYARRVRDPASIRVSGFLLPESLELALDGGGHQA